MVVIAECTGTVSDMPDLHRLVTTGRSDALAIVRPDDGVYRRSVASVAEEVVARSSVPDLYDVLVAKKCITTAGGDAHAIRRPGHCINLTCVIEGKDEIAGTGIPDVYSFIITGGSDARAIG